MYKKTLSAEMHTAQQMRFEHEAYRKMVKSALANRSHYESGDFLKTSPTSLYAAHRMLSRKGRYSSIKGQMIAQNWNTVRDGIENALMAGYNLSWKSYIGLATQIAVFVEEYENDIKDKSLNEIDSILTAIWDEWPRYYPFGGGERVRYEQNERGLGDDLMSGNFIESKRVISGVSSYYPILNKPGDPIETLLDAKKTFPDNQDAYVYGFIWSDGDTRSTMSEDYVNGELHKRIFSRLKAVYNMLANPAVEDNVYRKQELYNSIIELRKALDSLKNVTDPTSDKPLDEDDMKRIMAVRRIVASIMENAKEYRELYSLLQGIHESIRPERWFYNSESGFFSRFTQEWEKVLRRASGDWMRQEKEILSGLRKIDKLYDQLWRMVHVGDAIAPIKV